MKTCCIFKKIAISFLAVSLIITAIPFGGAKMFTTSASAAGTQDAQVNQEIIYNFIINEMGLNSAAACGILANIEYESNFNPNLYSDNGQSYGICQWHATRFTNLKDYCNSNGYLWTSLIGQLYYLKYELFNCQGDTGGVINHLYVDNTADGAYEAGYDWCYYFERPSNKEAKADIRGNSARNSYWPIYKTDRALGDMDNDGKVNSYDALIILEWLVGSRTLTSTQMKMADMNGNGKINSEDALIIIRISSGSMSFSDYD